MFGLIIFAYPISLIIGIIIGAKAQRVLPALIRSALIGAVLAAILSLEFVVIGFRQLLFEMMLPAMAFCATFGLVGALASFGVRRRLKNLGFPP